MEPLTVIPGFGVFPPEHTCDGADRSPEITVLDVLTPYLAIVMEDLDASMGTFTHWLVWNVPAPARSRAGSPGTPGLPSGSCGPGNERLSEDRLRWSLPVEGCVAPFLHPGLGS